MLVVGITYPKPEKKVEAATAPLPLPEVEEAPKKAKKTTKKTTKK